MQQAVKHRGVSAYGLVRDRNLLEIGLGLRLITHKCDAIVLVFFMSPSIHSIFMTGEDK